MNALIVLVRICCAAVLFAFLIARGHRTRAIRIKLPFVDIDTSSFGDLSPVKYFARLSMAVISPRPTLLNHDKLISTPPIVLIHVGWNIVCEAFITKFCTYPTDESIHSAASAIGGNNAEYVKMYRDIHKEAILSASVKQEFAIDYLLRAPSLSERITGGPFPIRRNKFVYDFIKVATESRELGIVP